MQKHRFKIWHYNLVSLCTHCYLASDSLFILLSGGCLKERTFFCRYFVLRVEENIGLSPVNFLTEFGINSNFIE